MKSISSTEDENGDIRIKSSSSAGGNGSGNGGDSIARPLPKSTKSLVPSIAVNVSQTLRDDVSPLLSIGGRTDDRNKLAHSSTASSATTSPRQERDKSSKRKSNLNRALNEEATVDGKIFVYGS